MKKLAMPMLAVGAMMAAAPKGAIGAPRAEGTPRNFEDLMRDVKSELTRIGDDVSKTAETAMNEAKRSGEMSAETKAAADRLLTQQGALQDTVKALSDRMKAAEGQTLELEQKLAGGGGSRGGSDRLTLGQAVTADDSVQAFNGRGTLRVEVKNAITTGGASGGALRQPYRDPEVVGIPRQSVHIRDLIPSVPVDQGSIEYARQTTRTNAAAPVAETTLKPESALAWTLENTPVQTIATWIPASRQALDDLPMLEGLIDTELRYMLDITEDAQLLAGDGVSPNLDGLITNATVYSGAAEAKISNPTLIDKLRVAMLEATLNLYPADGVVLHPEDWMVIETTKDADNRYIFANPTGIAGPVLWGRRVVPTLAMTVDKFLVGAFTVAATIYDRMDTEVLISSEDRDNFVKNMLTIRAEKRLALAVKRPQSLIYGDFGLVA